MVSMKNGQNDLYFLSPIATGVIQPHFRVLFLSSWHFPPFNWHTIAFPKVVSGHMYFSAIQEILQDLNLHPGVVTLAGFLRWY